MSVYVDNARIPYGRMIMSHMLADSLEELDSMANRIGISRRWRQRGHYDICQSKRKLAISYGAKVVTQREIAKIRSDHAEER